MTMNVRDFGAKGDGVADDSLAILNAIDATIGIRPPGPPIRTNIPHASLYFPAGVYNTTESLTIRSVQGFHLIGDGPDLTVIRVAAGRSLTSVLEIDGSENSIFEGFSVSSEPNGFADKMLYLHWSGSNLVQRSTSNNNFRNVNVGGQYRTAFAIGTELSDASKQCDGSIFEDCIVTGGWSLGETQGWQNGWEIGNGTHSNNLDHYLYGCSWSGVRYGLRINASNAILYGSQPGGAEVDIFITGSAHPIVIDGLRSEASSRLLAHGGGAADCHVSLRNVLWNAEQLNSDGLWIVRNTSGALVLENVVCLNPPAGVTPKIQVDSAGGNLVSCVATGVASPTPVEEAFSLGTGAFLTINNYHQFDSNSIIQKITPLRMMHGPTLLFHVP